MFQVADPHRPTRTGAAGRLQREKAAARVGQAGLRPVRGPATRTCGAAVKEEKPLLRARRATLPAAGRRHRRNAGASGIRPRAAAAAAKAPAIDRTAAASHRRGSCGHRRNGDWRRRLSGGDGRACRARPWLCDSPVRVDVHSEPPDRREGARRKQRSHAGAGADDQNGNLVGGSCKR